MQICDKANTIKCSLSYSQDYCQFFSIFCMMETLIRYEENQNQSKDPVLREGLKIREREKKQRAL